MTTLCQFWYLSISHGIIHVHNSWTKKYSSNTWRAKTLNRNFALPFLSTAFLQWQAYELYRSHISFCQLTPWRPNVTPLIVIHIWTMNIFAEKPFSRRQRSCGKPRRAVHRCQIFKPSFWCALCMFSMRLSRLKWPRAFFLLWPDWPFSQAFMSRQSKPRLVDATAGSPVSAWYGLAHTPRGSKFKTYVQIWYNARYGTRSLYHSVGNF
jgi:hypothetical protein